jgi:hypothetical protein
MAIQKHSGSNAKSGGMTTYLTLAPSIYRAKAALSLDVIAPGTNIIYVSILKAELMLASYGLWTECIDLTVCALYEQISGCTSSSEYQHDSTSLLLCGTSFNIRFYACYIAQQLAVLAEHFYAYDSLYHPSTNYSANCQRDAF